MAELIDVTIPGHKKSYPLKDITIIGRATTTDINLDDPLVSRHHARISKSENGFQIEDLGSRNGVYMNGNRTTAPHPLTNGCKICIGPYTLVFQDAESPTLRPGEGFSGEYTQIIVATKDTLPVASMGEAPCRVAPDKGDFAQLQKRLKIFQNITLAIGSIFDIDALLGEILRIVFDVFPHAGRCFVALQDAEELPMAIRTIQTRDASLVEDSGVMSQTLARRAIKERKSLLVMDTQMDSTTSVSIKVIGARSILCAPLICPRRTFGILQIESKSRNYEFSRADLDLFTGIASQVALLLYNAELCADLKAAKERIESENKNLKKQQKIRSSFSDIVGASGKFREVLEVVKKAGGAPYSVLITGESGTGKELIARAIHYNGARSGQPFVAVNCAAIPHDLLESELFGHEKGAFTGAVGIRQGLFEVAHTGTLFLDEIGDMHPHSQAKLLRVLQEKEVQRIGGAKAIKVDVRVLAATNRDLKSAMSKGEFREDLFYRLNVVPIHIPPLRERREDVPLLIDYFLASSCADVGRHIQGFTPGALALLINYSWPGNVRELRNVVERIVTLAPDGCLLDVETLPPEIGGQSPVRLQKYKSVGTLYEAQKQLEIEMITEALKSSEGNKSRAAELLGISRKVLYEKMDGYKIS